VQCAQRSVLAEKGEGFVLTKFAMKVSTVDLSQLTGSRCSTV